LPGARIGNCVNSSIATMVKGRKLDICCNKSVNWRGYL
jgi:hypothetical protein